MADVEVNTCARTGRYRSRNGSISSILPPRQKVVAAQARLSQGNTSSVKWFAGLGEYIIDWGPGYWVYLARDAENLIVLFGGGTKQRQQRDINRAKELLVEYKARKAKLKREKPGEQRRRKKR